MNNPRVHADNCAPRYESATNICPGRANNALVVKAEGWMHPEGFLKACIQVGKSTGIGVPSIQILLHCGCAWETRVELMLEFGITARVTQKIIEEGSQSNGTEVYYQLQPV